MVRNARLWPNPCLNRVLSQDLIRNLRRSLGLILNLQRRLNLSLKS
jgi:hypothetical protein